MFWYIKLNSSSEDRFVKRSCSYIVTSALFAPTTPYSQLPKLIVAILKQQSEKASFIPIDTAKFSNQICPNSMKEEGEARGREACFNTRIKSPNADWGLRDPVLQGSLKTVMSRCKQPTRRRAKTGTYRLHFRTVEVPSYLSHLFSMRNDTLP